MAKVRVVPDTNVYISALLWTGIPHRLLRLAEAGELTLAKGEKGTFWFLGVAMKGGVNGDRLVFRESSQRMTPESELQRKDD